MTNRVEVRGEVAWQDGEVRKWKTKDGQEGSVGSAMVRHKHHNTERFSIFKLEGWGPYQEAVASLKQGDVVLVSGELKSESWKDKDTDQWRHGRPVIAVGSILVEESAVAHADTSGLAPVGADDDVPF